MENLNECASERVGVRCDASYFRFGIIQLPTIHLPFTIHHLPFRLPRHLARRPSLMLPLSQKDGDADTGRSTGAEPASGVWDLSTKRMSMREKRTRERRSQATPVAAARMNRFIILRFPYPSTKK